MNKAPPIVHTILDSPVAKGQKKVSSASAAKARSKKRAWTMEEDAKLKLIVETDSMVEDGADGSSSKKQRRWSKIADSMVDRTGKQCRERWNYHLRPDLKKGQWSMAEDAVLFCKQRELGNSWSKIAQSLPGRTDNDIKNRWHSIMRQQHGENNTGKPKTKTKKTADDSAKKTKSTRKQKASKALPPSKVEGMMSPLVSKKKKQPPMDTKKPPMDPATAVRILTRNGGALPEIPFDPAALEQVDEMALSFAATHQTGIDHHPTDVVCFGNDEENQMANITKDTYTPSVFQDRAPLVEETIKSIDKDAAARPSWHDGAFLAASALYNMNMMATPQQPHRGGKMAVKHMGIAGGTEMEVHSLFGSPITLQSFEV